MTENQLIKLKNRLLNIQTQLQGGALVLGRSTTEQNIRARLETALKTIKDCYELTDGIETYEPTKAENQRARKKKRGSIQTLYLIRSSFTEREHRHITFNVATMASTETQKARLLRERVLSEWICAIALKTVLMQPTMFVH